MSNPLSSLPVLLPRLASRPKSLLLRLLRKGREKMLRPRQQQARPLRKSLMLRKKRRSYGLDVEEHVHYDMKYLLYEIRWRDRKEILYECKKYKCGSDEGMVDAVI